MNFFLYAHLFTIIPVILLGPSIFIRKKGDKLHKIAGRIWAILMLVSCLLSLGVRSPDGGFSWLHGLAIFTIYSVFMGIREAKNGDIDSHKKRMIGPYVGAVIAMLFAFTVKGRFLNSWLISLF